MTEKKSSCRPVDDTTIIEHLNWQLDVNAALAELYKFLSSPETSIEEITHVILEQAKILTESEHGFVSIINPETRYIICPTLATMLKKECKMDGENQGIAFPPGKNGSYDGLWGYALNTHKPFYTNTPHTHPAALGVPQGHLALERFLAFPVMLGDELAGMIALANSGRDYTDRDLAAIQRLAEFFTLAIQRKRSADNLRISEDKFRKLFEVAIDGIVLADAQTNEILDCNTAICQLVEREKHDLIGKSQEILYPPPPTPTTGDRVPGFFCLTQNCEKDECKVVETQVITLSGKIKEVAIKANLLELGGKKVLQEMFRDITEKKQAGKDLEKYREHLEELVKERTAELAAANERLRQAQKMEAIGALAGGIAHDFNNILGVIIGYTELIMDETPAGSLPENNLNHILTAAHRAKDMVNKLLTFSRKIKEERRPVLFSDIIQDATKFLQSTIPTSIDISVALEENLSPLAANPTQLLQIILNICNNAIHAMSPEGGALKIELKEINHAGSDSLAPGKYQHLTISDTGHGMGPEILTRIFEPFFTSKKVGEGMGMGMAVVHGIVKGHRGEITVDSEPGKGARVHVYLPVAPKEE
ncbi:MAG: ATP-binding protein [Candidatus Aminicenantes bacterium]|nr:ATP-binding protein [Candidatus Aminicenantes bacterium]